MDAVVALATANPHKRRALARPDVADDITDSSRQAVHSAFGGIADLLNRSRADGPMRDVPPSFVLTLTTAIAEATIDTVIREPAEAEARSSTGFDAVWRTRRVPRPGRHLASATTAKETCMPSTPSASPKAWIITGPTSGIGRRAALELASHGTVVLAGRDPAKLAEVQAAIQARPGGHAVTVVCDLSDIKSVRRAAAEIVTLGLPLAGLLNNAGIMPSRPGHSAQGWDIAFAANHLGPFAFTEALIPHLPDGANVVFTCSGVEDPERKPAVTAGFRGGRYISAEASARGEWAPGGSSRPGFDAYATSMQCELASVCTFARETPRLRFSAAEPGFNPGTGLGRDAPAFLPFIAKYLIAPLAPMIKYWSTPPARRPCPDQGPDQRVRPDRGVLRRKRQADDRVRPGPRPCLRRPGRRRDPRPARHRPGGLVHPVPPGPRGALTKTRRNPDRRKRAPAWRCPASRDRTHRVTTAGCLPRALPRQPGPNRNTLWMYGRPGLVQGAVVASIRSGERARKQARACRRRPGQPGGDRGQHGGPHQITAGNQPGVPPDGGPPQAPVQRPAAHARRLTPGPDTARSAAPSTAWAGPAARRSARSAMPRRGGAAHTGASQAGDPPSAEPADPAPHRGRVTIQQRGGLRRIQPCSDSSTITARTARTARTATGHRPRSTRRIFTVSLPGPLANTLTGRLLTTTSPDKMNVAPTPIQPRQGPCQHLPAQPHTR